MTARVRVEFHAADPTEARRVLEQATRAVLALWPHDCKLDPPCETVDGGEQVLALVGQEYSLGLVKVGKV